MKIHLLHKAETVLSRSSTQTEVEVEDVVQVKDVVEAVATRIKASSNNRIMMRRVQTLVDVDSPEAGGEVAGTPRETMQIMIAGNAGIVEEEVTFRVTVHQGIKVIEDSRTIMHLLAEMQMTIEASACLLCSM